MTHHSVMTSSLRTKNLKIFDFPIDIDYNSKTYVFRDYLPYNELMWARHPADTKCPPAAQRKQAKRGCVIIIEVYHAYLSIHCINFNADYRYRLHLIYEKKTLKWLVKNIKMACILKYMLLTIFEFSSFHLNIIRPYPV